MALRAPPPPPPPPPTPSPSRTAASSTQTPQEVTEEIDCLVQPLYQRNRENGGTVYTLVHKDVNSVIQQGPMCGLVAIAMASQLITGRILHQEELLVAAKRKGYSKQGEMFSAHQLMDLAVCELNCSGCVLSVSELNIIELLTAIAKRNALLVPYDKDKNNSPCLARGHCAHWCTLIGFAISTKLPDSSISHIELSPSSFNVDLFRGVELEQVYVFARQGTSKHMGLWSLSVLLKSNANLIEPGDCHNPDDYIIPAPGLSHSLSSLIVLLSSK